MTFCSEEDQDKPLETLKSIFEADSKIAKLHQLRGTYCEWCAKLRGELCPKCKELLNDQT